MLVASQDSNKDDSLNEEEFGKLIASIQASNGEGKSFKTFSDEYKPYNIKESMLQALGQASFANLDENSNESIGWYEMRRYLQTATLRASPKPTSKGSVAGGGSGRPASGGSGRPASGGAGRQGGGDPSQFVGFIMTRYDTDMDGELSESEINATTDPSRMQAADTDKDGKVSKAELLEMLKKAAAAGGGGQRAGGQRKGGGQPKSGGGQ